MARYIISALCLVQLLVCACACFSGGGSSGGGGSSNNWNVPRSNSGRPFGVYINENTEAYPDYNRDFGTVGVGVEHRPSDGVSVNGHVGSDLGGNPAAAVGVRIRPSDGVSVNGHIGSDLGGNPAVGVGLNIKFKRSIENATADTIHRELFSVLDSNKDGQLDVAEWSGEGGKVLSFASLIVDHDQDKDEKISLAEFQQTRIQPGLRMILDRLDSFLGKDHEE